MGIIKQIKDVYDKKGYHFFSLDKPYNLNIIGIRSENRVSNSFDDLFYMIYNDEKQDVILSSEGTTDPGAYWLQHPMNTDGTFIMKPDQYMGLWRVGKHRNEYEAFVQNGPVTGYRDNNLDNILDFDPNSLVTGMYGINMHRSNPYTESYYVNKWSAGCQVHKKVSNFDQYIDAAKKSLRYYGNSFSYTLLEEKDFS